MFKLNKCIKIFTLCFIVTFPLLSQAVQIYVDPNASNNSNNTPSTANLLPQQNIANPTPPMQTAAKNSSLNSNQIAQNGFGPSHDQLSAEPLSSMSSNPAMPSAPQNSLPVNNTEIPQAMASSNFSNAQPSVSPPSTNNVPSSALTYDEKAKDKWMQSCLKSASKIQTQAYAQSFCECSWNKLSTSIPASVWISSNQQELKQLTTTLNTIRQVCEVEMQVSADKTYTKNQ